MPRRSQRSDANGGPRVKPQLALRISAFAEAVRSSLFFTPLLFVLGGAALAVGVIYVDQRFRTASWPAVLDATVDSARTLLGTVAGATLTVAGVAFSIALLTYQLASSQFSPRVLHSFFRDPMQKRVMGVVLGTFTYSLIVLRSVHQPGQPDSIPFTPRISTVVGVVLGIVAILAIVAFINHSAHSMQVGEIIRRVSDATRQQAERLYPAKAGEGEPDRPFDPPDGDPLIISSGEEGWVQQVDAEALLRAAPPNGVVRLDVGAGFFANEGAPLCAIWPRPEDEEEARVLVHRAVAIGRARTMQQDISFGIRQLADIALRALSPGINDPTTAVEVIVHLGGVMRTILLRDIAGKITSGPDGKTLLRPHDYEHADYVDAAFGQLRLAAGAHPAVALQMLRILAMLVLEVTEAGVPHRAIPLRMVARDLIAQVKQSSLIDSDVAAVTAAAERFGLVEG